MSHLPAEKNESCFLGRLWSKSSGEVVCLCGRGEWVYLLWLLHVQTAPNCKVVWCGVCDVTWCLICVCGLNQRLCPVSFPSFLLSFFSLCLSSLRSCIMWSGWTCIVIRPYGGGGVSESAWRRLNNSKQSFLSMGTPLGQTRFKCGSVLVSQPDRGLTLILTWHRFWSQQLIFEKPFLCICFSFLLILVVLLFYSVFLKSVMVQTDSSLLFFIILNYDTHLLFLQSLVF